MEYPDNYLLISEQANTCRRIWNISENSPINIFNTVLNKVDNVTICFLDMEDNLSGSSLKVGQEKIIFINSKHSLGRQRFTLAHELYHLEYQKDFYSCDIQSDSEIEENADQFASCLLMSNGALINYELENNIKEWTLDEIIQTEQYFQISHKAMLRRLRTLGKITQEQSDEYSYEIKFNAKIRGYDLKLYEPYSNDDNLIMGNYLPLIEKAYNYGLISDGKKEELIIDGFFDKLEKNISDDLIE